MFFVFRRDGAADRPVDCHLGEDRHLPPSSQAGGRRKAEPDFDSVFCLYADPDSGFCQHTKVEFLRVLFFLKFHDFRVQKISNIY